MYMQLPSLLLCTAEQGTFCASRKDFFKETIKLHCMEGKITGKYQVYDAMDDTIDQFQ